MASETIGDSDDDLNWRVRVRWTENSKVYTRRNQKKAHQNSLSKDTSTNPTTSAAEIPTTSASENPTPPVETTGVSSPAVAAAVKATAKKFNDSAVASSPPAATGSPGPTITSGGDSGNNVLEEPVEAIVVEAKDVHSSPLHQEKLQHQQQTPSLCEGKCSSPNGGQEGSEPQDFEVQNLKKFASVSTSDVTENINEQSSLHSPNEKLQASENGPHNLRESSPLSDLPNGGEVAPVQVPIKNKVQSDGELMPDSPTSSNDNGPPNTNGVVKPLLLMRVDDRVIINLSKATPKNELEELGKKLESELDRVRRLLTQLEAKNLHLSQVSNSNLDNSNYIDGYSQPQPPQAHTDVVERRSLVRINSKMGSVGHQKTRPVGLARVSSDVGATRSLGPRPYNRQLSVAVMDNTHMTGEIVEKRTPKANQYYRNSEFLLGKDRLPPESNKRLKTNNGRKHGGELEHTFGFGFGFDKNRNQVFKSCNSLLQKLMKHKLSWVFNEPVDAKVLGLRDYHDIIKHPMDLGTIKTRLSQNWYKSPREFAEDVRLVFCNAMTYNPKGQDVHIMAEELSGIFEERWAVIETENDPFWKDQMYQNVHTPTSRKPVFSHAFTPSAALPRTFVPPPPAASTPVFAPQMSAYDRPETATTQMAIDWKVQYPHSGRTPVPKKPKAKDPNKRDMTYEEKQRLSTNLQDLATEKIDAIIQIIKKNNTALSQNDDEIEVDIDSVDPETLWELDRFVTNYKKSVSKNKRKAELALQAKMNTTPAAAAAEVQNKRGKVLEEGTTPPDAVEVEKQGRSSSSSSSSSDSGSSSSDSDSDSSSAGGSDAG